MLPFLRLEFLLFNFLSINVSAFVFHTAILIPRSFFALFFAVDKLTLDAYLAIFIPLDKASVLAPTFVVGL